MSGDYAYCQQRYYPPPSNEHHPLPFEHYDSERVTSDRFSAERFSADRYMTARLSSEPSQGSEGEDGFYGSGGGDSYRSSMQQNSAERQRAWGDDRRPPPVWEDGMPPPSRRRQTVKYPRGWSARALQEHQDVLLREQYDMLHGGGGGFDCMSGSPAEDGWYDDWGELGSPAKLPRTAHSHSEGGARSGPREQWAARRSVASRTFPMTAAASGEMLRMSVAHAKHQLIHGPPREAEQQPRQVGPLPPPMQADRQADALGSGGWDGLSFSGYVGAQLPESSWPDPRGEDLPPQGRHSHWTEVSDGRRDGWHAAAQQPPPEAHRSGAGYGPEGYGPNDMAQLRRRPPSSVYSMNAARQTWMDVSLGV